MKTLPAKKKKKKLVKVSNMVLNMLLGFFCFLFLLFISRVLITLYSLTLKTGLDDMLCALFRPKNKRKKKKKEKKF